MRLESNATFLFFKDLLRVKERYLSCHFNSILWALCYFTVHIIARKFQVLLLSYFAYPISQYIAVPMLL